MKNCVGTPSNANFKTRINIDFLSNLARIALAHISSLCVVIHSIILRSNHYTEPNLASFRAAEVKYIQYLCTCACTRKDLSKNTF